MAQPAWQTYLVWVLKGNLVVWAVNGVVFAALAAMNSGAVGLAVSGFFSKITLLETGVAFLVGGAIAFSGSALPSKAREQILKSSEEAWSLEKLRRGEKRANKFILLAVVLFIECLFVSFLGF